MAEDIKIVGLANPKRSTGVSMKIIGAIIGVVVLAVGVMAGFYLVGQPQDIREEASTCVEQCPAPGDTLLQNCHPPESDGTSTDSLCSGNDLGRIEFCGTSNYCCNGSIWTNNMSACATSSPTPSPSPSPSPTLPSIVVGTTTPIPTPTSTATAIATSASATATSASATRTPTSQPTAMPIPETGASWQTILGGGIGLVVILASLALAL